MQLMDDLKEACADLRKEIIQEGINIETLKDVLKDSSENVITNTSKLLELRGQEKLLLVNLCSAMLFRDAI